MTVSDQIRQARKELGISEYRIPTSKSKQKHLLNQLQTKLHQKKIETSTVPVVPEPTRDNSNTFLEEPRNRRVYVKMVQSYQNSFKYELKRAIASAAEDQHCRIPSVQTYYAWEAVVRTEDEQGNKVLTDEQGKKIVDKSKSLPALKKDEQEPFVEMVYEFAATNNVELKDARLAIAERLGVVAPGLSTLYTWKYRYQIDVPTLKKGSKTSEAPVVEPIVSPEPQVEKEVKMDDMSYCETVIRRATKEELKRLSHFIEIRKAEMIKYIDDKIKELEQERAQLR